MHDPSAWIDDHANDLLDAYMRLHTMPELGFQEFKTSAYLAEELRKAGYEVHDKLGGSSGKKEDPASGDDVPGTGIVAILRGAGPGPGLAFRADMDALPMTEQTGLPFASQSPGVMHACGHDANAVNVLFAAKALAATGGIRHGSLYIIFQPAEELLAGAKVIMESGLLQGVDEMIGLHMRSAREVKVGDASPSIRHGGNRRLKAVIQGKAAHAGWVHEGVNVMDAVAAIVPMVNAIHADPRVSHSVKITRCFAGGPATNIIPDYAELAFDLRAATNAVMDELETKTRRAILAGAAGTGTEAEVECIAGVPAAQPDPALVAELAASIESVLGKGRAAPSVETLGSEDFHTYSVDAGIKTAYLGVGADMGTGGHTPTMKLDLTALPYGAKILAHLACAKLR